MTTQGETTQYVSQFWRHAIFFIAGGVIGGLLTYIVLTLWSPSGTNFFPIRANNSKYPLINQLLACGYSESKEMAEYKPLKDTLTTEIQTITNGNPSIKVSVYFRDLIDGRWTGINENERYSPASLLKVPTMIAYFKAAEQNPKVLNTSFTYDGSDSNVKEYFRSTTHLVDGMSYTVNELIANMIEKSDNNASDVLLQNIDSASLNEIYSDLGLPVPADERPDIDFMSPKSYAFLFRILYNATYLSEPYSQKALQLLSAPDFPQGIQAGIPNTVIAAQKFGERAVYNTPTVLDHTELHDCGIIYYPKRPYLLCVMTRGLDFDQLAHIIASISKTVYTFVDQKVSSGK